MPDPLSDWIAVTRPWGAELFLHHGDRAELLPRPAVDAVGLIVVVDGRAVLRVADRRLELATGSVVLLVDGAAHEVEALGAADAPAVLLLGAYGGSRCPVTSVWAGSDRLVHLDAATTAAVPTVRAIVDILVGEMGASAGGIEPMVGGLLDALMVAILRAATRAPDGTWLRGADDAVAGPALRAMHRAPAEPWTLERLARVAGVSRSLFARRFATQVGESPMEYLRRWRMAMASRLLLSDADREIEAIARAVGYESQYAFSRAFKRVVGEPPGRFRRRLTA